MPESLHRFFRSVSIEMQPFKRSRSFSHLFRKTALILTAFASFGQSPTSPSELMRQVVHALELRNEHTLKALAITKADFKRFVWPSLSRTLLRLGMNVDTFYLTTVKESESGLASTLSAWGGRKMEVIEVAELTPERHPTRRKRFRAFSGPAVTIRDESGQQRTLHLVGGIIELDGVYKVSTYSLAPDQTP
jgi:hypothetical protein